MRDNTATLNTLHAKTAFKVVSARKAPKDRAKTSESAIIIKNEKASRGDIT